MIIVQPGAVTGAGDVSPQSDLFRYYLRRMPVMFGAKSGLTLAHVDDIAEGYALAMERGRPGESYIIAGPHMTYRQLFDICESSPGSLRRSSGPQVGWRRSRLASLADYTFWATADKATRELGWAERPVEETIREVLDYERARMKR